MEISPRKTSKRTQEPVDEWLHNEGYYRKHAPRDPTCLFRAVSEQVYLTQYFHIRVRKECVDFMREIRELFEEDLTIPFESYLEQMACFTEWGGIHEIQAMSLLYKKEFVIFNGHKQTRRAVTNNGFSETIYLCHTPPKQYESVYTKQFVANAAFCQSIVYQTLYEGVFKMNNIQSTVNKMLHDRNAVFRHNKFFLKGNLEIRDQLTMEIYNKLESNVDENDDGRSISKGAPPFPYRVAKALDPNIYRNTDFDIWHEIRKEVKSAGWTKHNSHELQVGGKCLVQIYSNEENIDMDNNNSGYSLDNDANDNETKITQKRPKSPVSFYGHIQEMADNEGPVLVFIEELGEKRIVPYSFLKPLPYKKNRLNLMPVCHKNLLPYSNQKCKKGFSSGSRKGKEAGPPFHSFPSNLDKNGNVKSNFNSTTGHNYQIDQWPEESLKTNDQQAYDHYSVDKNSNFTTANLAEVFPNPNVAEKSEHSTTVMKQEVHKESGNISSFNIAPGNNMNRSTTPVIPLHNDNNDTFNLHSKPRVHKDAYNSSDNSEVLPANINSPYSGIDNNSFRAYDQMNRMLCAVNCSVQKSVDVNGGDLPLSDLFTLRFFYNLGLEYFRAGNWNYTANGHPGSSGQWFQGAPGNDEIANLASSFTQDCTIVEKKDASQNLENSEEQHSTQETIPNTTNNPKGILPSKTESPKVEIAKQTFPVRGKPKTIGNENRDTTRLNRNSLAPRFKRNLDNRNRNINSQTNVQRQSNNSPAHGPNTYNRQESKGDNGNNSNVNSPQSMQLHPPAAAPNSYPPYVQQGMYAGVPYYGNEAESFGTAYYPPNSAFVPVPCVSHTEMSENNNVSAYQSHLCTGVDYTQSYPGMCSPYMCSSPSFFNMPAQNIPEHWYAVPGQPHFMQYTPMVPVSPEATCNVPNQVPNHNSSP